MSENNNHNNKGFLYGLGAGIIITLLLMSMIGGSSDENNFRAEMRHRMFVQETDLERMERKIDDIRKFSKATMWMVQYFSYCMGCPVDVPSKLEGLQ